MLSLVPPEIMLPSDICKEVSPPALQPMLSWFQHTFQQLPPALPQSPDEDDFAGKADGLDSVTAQLQAVAVAKQGTAKQLQALFVSLCRAQALLVRSVRCELFQIQSLAVLLYILHCSSPDTAWSCGVCELYRGAEGAAFRSRQYKQLHCVYAAQLRMGWFWSIQYVDTICFCSTLCF